MRGLLGALVCLLIAGPAFAQQTGTSIIKQFAEESKTNDLTFHANLSMSTYEYKEPGLMKVSGTMIGLQGAGLYRPQDDGLFLSAGIDYFFGSPTYDGSLMDGRPESHSTSDYFYTIQASGGYTIPVTPEALLDVSGGLARRYLNDKGDGRGSYEREQSYIYLPIILQGRYAISSDMSAAVGFERDVFIRGRNTTHLSDVAEGAPDLHFSQSSGSGLKLFAAFNGTINTLPVRFEVYHRTWNVDQSDMVAFNAGDRVLYFVEPKNETSQTGASAGIRF